MKNETGQTIERSAIFGNVTIANALRVEGKIGSRGSVDIRRDLVVNAGDVTIKGESYEVCIPEYIVKLVHAKLM